MPNAERKELEEQHFSFFLPFVFEIAGSHQFELYGLDNVTVACSWLAFIKKCCCGIHSGGIPHVSLATGYFFGQSEPNRRPQQDVEEKMRNRSQHVAVACIWLAFVKKCCCGLHSGWGTLTVPWPREDFLMKASQTLATATFY